MTQTERPWAAFYGADTRADIEEPPYRTLGDLVRSVADTYGDAPAFTACMPNGMNGTLSFAQVDEMSDAFAVYLREVAGLSKGDRVALQMPNGLAFPVAAFGILKAGCVLVNVNPLYTAEEMGRQFKDAEPHALVIVDMFADKIADATRGHPIPNIIVTRVAEFLPSLPRGIIGLVQKHWDRSVKPVEVPHIRLPDALEAGRLVQVLPGWHPPDIWLTLYYPPYDVLPARVAAFSDLFERLVLEDGSVPGSGSGTRSGT